MNLKRNKFLIFLFFSCCFFCACKTQKAERAVAKENIAVIQVCDKYQMSFVNLPCVAFLSDGSTRNFKTDTSGKIIIKLTGGLKVIKLVYDFENYRRAGGQILAVDDFQYAKKLKFDPAVRFASVEEPVSDKIKNLFVLIR